MHIKGGTIMSLEFSRRSFLKYTAVAAVAVAGASMFSGCDTSNPNQPAGKTGDTLEIMGKHTLTKPTYSDKTLKFHMNIACTSKTGISVKANYFTVYVTRGDNTTWYNNYGTPEHVSLTKGVECLFQDQVLDTDVTVSDIDIAAGDTVLVRYWSRPVAANGNDAYQDCFATWDISADVAKKAE